MTSFGRRVSGIASSFWLICTAPPENGRCQPVREDPHRNHDHAVKSSPAPASGVTVLATSPGTAQTGNHSPHPRATATFASASASTGLIRRAVGICV